MEPSKDGRGNHKNSIENLNQYNEKMRKSSEECIDALRKANELVEGELSISDYRNLDITPSHGTISKRFGSWNEAKEKAGLKSTASPQEIYNREPPEILSYTKEDWQKLSKNRRHRRRQQARIAEKKLKKGCYNCGYDGNPVVLDYHHKDVSDKFMSVSEMVNQGYKFERILEEIEKCDLLCANCHRLQESGDIYSV